VAGRRNPLGIVLLVLDVVAWAVFGFFLVKTITTATSLTTCTVSGCTTTAQSAADYVPWVVGAAFTASILLTAAILAFRMRGTRSGPTSWDEVARMGAGGATAGGWNQPGTPTPGWTTSPGTPGPGWSPTVAATEFALPQAGPPPSRPDPTAPHATIVATRPKGLPDGRMILDVDMDVIAPGQPPRRVTKQVTAPMGGLARLYSGATVPVRLDPANPSDVTLVLDS
jgi:hypothetical protein